MTDGTTPWPPRVGDRVRVVATGEVGTVVKIRRTGVDRQFMVALGSMRARDVAPDSIGAAADPAAAPVLVCALDALEPSTT